MNDKKNKLKKIKAQLPRGFVDHTSAEIKAIENMILRIREIYELYGFDPIETPLFEYSDALGKFLPDSERPNAGVFSLMDDDKRWISLRYDLTAPLARHFAENYNNIQMPYRTYRSGWVFRNEKPGPGRFRQFMQFDADIIGAPSVTADVEICMMISDTMEKLGISRGNYVVRVNNRKLLDGLMEVIGLSGEENTIKRLGVLRAVDKLERLGQSGVLDLLGKGRKDESGDFTHGADLNEKQIECVLGYLNAEGKNGGEKLAKIGEQIINLGGSDKIVNDTSDMIKLIYRSGYEGRIDFDPSVVRGLEYYTGPVYECELTFPVSNKKGEIVRFGSIAGGGRYDGLIHRFRGEYVPATGFSIGVSRLISALQNLGKIKNFNIVAPVIVCVMERDLESICNYQQITQSLRNSGIRAEMYQGNPKNFGKQLSYADKRGCGIAIIQGADEKRNSQVQIKDLIKGNQLSKEITDNATWRKVRPAQITVAQADLVTKVKEILAMQASGYYVSDKK